MTEIQSEHVECNKGCDIKALQSYMIVISDLISDGQPQR